jgi:hypothetical protein
LIVFSEHDGYIQFRPSVPVEAKLKQWATRRNKDVLPRKRESLKKCLEPLCQIPMQANLEFIVNQLEKDGFIEKEGMEARYKGRK